MRKIYLKTGDIVTLRPIEEVIKDYGKPDEKGWIKVGNQSYSEEMYNKYKTIFIQFVE